MHRRVLRGLGVLLLGAALAAGLGACGRRSPTGVEGRLALRIRTVLPPSGGSAGSASPSALGEATALASVDSMSALLISVYEQTDQGETLCFSGAHYPETYDVPDSLLQWEVTVPWAFRYRIEIEAIGTRHRGGDFGGFTGAGLQYLGEARVDATPSLPQQVTVSLRDVVPMPWVEWSNQATVARWAQIPGASSYAINGRMYGAKSNSDTQVTENAMDLSAWAWIQVRANLPYGRMSAYSYPIYGGAYATRSQPGR
jgi:hypothetical protein